MSEVEVLNQYASRLEKLSLQYNTELCVILHEMREKRPKLFPNSKTFFIWIKQHSHLRSDSNIFKYLQAGKLLLERRNEGELEPESMEQLFDVVNEEPTRYGPLRRNDLFASPEKNQYLSLKHSSNNQEWYTPKWLLHPILEVLWYHNHHQVLGEINLDPASSLKANEVIQAEKYYTKQDNGLQQRWFGKVFCNPPSGIILGVKSLLLLFWEAAVNKYEVEYDEGLFLLKLDLQSPAYHHFLTKPFCLLSNMKFRPNGEETEYLSPHGYVMVYFGTNVDHFVSVFENYGSIPGRNKWAAITS
jgi:hypothetical protein